MGKEPTSRIAKMLAAAKDRRELDAFLKSQSPYYPEVYTHDMPESNSFILTTLIRIEREGIWYDIHQVIQWSYADGHLLDAVRNAYQQLMIQAYKLQLFYQVDLDNLLVDSAGNSLSPVSPIQIDEKTRMIDQNYWEAYPKQEEQG